MAAVRSAPVSVKSDSGTDRSESDSGSESDRDVREAEPMEVEEGELEPEDISVNRSLKELLPVSLQTKAFSQHRHCRLLLAAGSRGAIEFVDFGKWLLTNYPHIWLFFFLNVTP